MSLMIDTFGGSGTFGGDGAFGDVGIPTYVINRGNFEVLPVVRIYGGCADPAVINLTTGEMIVMSGSIQSGDWVEFDVQAGTILDSSGIPRFSLLSPESTDFKIAPGSNKITFGASVFDQNARVVVSWRNAYL